MCRMYKKLRAPYSASEDTGRRNKMIRTVIEVDGMFCSMCESRVSETILKVLPARKARADRKKKEAVILSEDPLDEKALRKCIEDAGYDTGKITSEEYKKKGLFGF